MISRCQLEALKYDYEAYQKAPSGTGPYKFDKLVPQERIEFVKNSDYWDKSRMPQHDRLILLPMPEATTQVRNLDFVEAARAIGARGLNIIRHHILGNVLGPVFTYASSLVSVSIIIASGLSFLGLGVEPPAPDWGLMLNTLRQAIYITPAVAALPGLLIFITSMCFNLLSDGLRAAMDVRL